LLPRGRLGGIWECGTLTVAPRLALRAAGPLSLSVDRPKQLGMSDLRDEQRLLICKLRLFQGSKTLLQILEAASFDFEGSL
jgi:hypothetical protein